ncbi:hypothetical protein [Variovorax sp. J31P207]|uniref:hypothetical protein n=1 Tax=Variovorax sp. J31P207 TaxID=3053510 RepID=UPI0025770550|nr:hypothetical protein [Variovorax sp. J31P207]MDM0071745.1 hypothetical protein [Variovorax sp. J31P207]
MVKKLQLKDEQWTKLVNLANDSGTEAKVEPSHASARLRSHRLVSQDVNGLERVTEQGTRRLSQGR